MIGNLFHLLLDTWARAWPLRPQNYSILIQKTGLKTLAPIFSEPKNSLLVHNLGLNNCTWRNMFYKMFM